MAIKTSNAMDAALKAYAQNGGWATFSGYDSRKISIGTSAALVIRGLIEYGRKDSGEMGHYLTEAGWACLGLERPRHAAGRYTLAEALEAAYTGTEDVLASVELPTDEADRAQICKGCTGTCCTGVGSDPCTCSFDDEDDEEAAEDENLCPNGQDRQECTEIDPCESCYQDSQDEGDEIEESMGLRNRAEPEPVVEPKTGSLAAEDFRPGYRYWAVRPGFEDAWTIKSVTLQEAAYQVQRDGKLVTPILVMHVRRDGSNRLFELGEEIAIQGPWKTA